MIFSFQWPLVKMNKMTKLDIEEKFKKDISKEVANLKEFLISQGKEIVKLKQENKVIIIILDP